MIYIVAFIVILVVVIIIVPSLSLCRAISYRIRQVRVMSDKMVNSALIRPCIRRQYHILTAACVLCVFIVYLVYANGYIHKPLWPSFNRLSVNRRLPDSNNITDSSKSRDSVHVHNRDMGVWPDFSVHLLNHVSLHSWLPSR